jgi:hypothetical protein
MTEFDSFFFGEILLSAVSFLITLIGERKRKMAIVALAFFLLASLLSIFLAHELGWESTILGIPKPTEGPGPGESISTSESTDDVSDQQSTVSEPTQNNDTVVVLGELDEIHTPNDTPNDALFRKVDESHSPINNKKDFVEFREWDSFSDADLHNEQYMNKEGLFIMFSDKFGSTGAPVEGQIEAEIHLEINPEKNLDGLVWSGIVVAEQRTFGSSAYANVSILVDGVEKWRMPEMITGNTRVPVEFSVDLSNAQYEVIIKMDCTLSKKGLALGFVNMDYHYS